jgi:hypothetical protein
MTESTGIRRDEIRCTSVPGCKLPIGADASTVLPFEVTGADVFLCLITADAVQSAYVLFEAGARWGAGKKVFPLLGPGASVALLPAPISGRHAARTSVRTDMQQFVREMAGELGAGLANAEVYDRALDALVQHSSAQGPRLARVS